ncbi:hypothetical protein F444_00863 [Phytophthora nicotianae P1976]|uniref:Uncharacterized protein n=1 Tax=Phytophthora nicotianae P1976 TaxID=1317066 RepID=A0A081B2T3_PHYNI|nr:hypothetical protein F444_00863 [Phytophthora nicotianae P1976]
MVEHARLHLHEADHSFQSAVSEERVNCGKSEPKDHSKIGSGECDKEATEVDDINDRHTVTDDKDSKSTLSDIYRQIAQLLIRAHLEAEKLDSEKGKQGRAGRVFARQRQQEINEGSLRVTGLHASGYMLPLDYDNGFQVGVRYTNGYI